MRQHDAGDAGQGQRRAEQDQAGEPMKAMWSASAILAKRPKSAVGDQHVADDEHRRRR
jgi:hypothetical protein